MTQFGSSLEDNALRCTRLRPTSAKIEHDLYCEGVMTGSVPTDRPRSTTEFLALAKSRLSLDVPEALTNPQVIPRLDDPDPAVIAAIAAVRLIRTAAVLVPIVERRELTVLFTERTSHLRDHAGQIAFPGGKIDALDATPSVAALREAEEEIGLDKRFIEPIGYLDVHVTPSGFRILPVVARVHEGFSLRINSDEVTDVLRCRSNS